MGVTVAVAGASGYAGGELLRLLASHPGIELGALTAGDASVGMGIGDVHPHLVTLADRELATTNAETLGDADVVMLALPHGSSAAIADALPERCLVVDLGADRRLRSSSAWELFYPGHPWSPAWPYGLPELPGAREALAGSRRAAVPGCHATATILSLAPLLAAGLVHAEGIVTVSASGTSGAGAAPSRRLLGSEVMGDVSAYKVADHQHTPEIAQALGIDTLSFTPLLVPMPRGILATSTAALAPGVTSQNLWEALQAAYAEEAFVQVLPAGRQPHTASVSGTNSAHLQVTLQPHSGRAVVTCAIDNLGKGAAGQAVQVLNVLLGLPETTGLAIDGIAP